MSTSAPPEHDDRAISWTYAVNALRTSFGTLKTLLESGHVLSLIPRRSDISDDSGVVLLNPTVAIEEMENRLEALRAKLDEFEHRLRCHGKWRPDDRPTDEADRQIFAQLQVVGSEICDLEDLEVAISLLDCRIPSSTAQPASLTLTSSITPSTPQSFFSTLNWEWDNSWREFYARLPLSPNTYLYLSRWKIDPAAGNWIHCPVAHRVDLTPEKASETLGRWEDWKWDRVWREWYVPISDEDEGEEDHVFMYANAWRPDADGWELVS